MVQQRVTFGLGGGITPVVRRLLILNIGIFLIQLLFNWVSDSSPFIQYLALRPTAIAGSFAIWQLVTYAFLHGGIFHIFFNMLILWMFGCDVERVLSARKFIKYYLITAVGAGVFQVLSNWGEPVSIIGASGAIYGILVAFALFFPDRQITLLLFFVFPVALKAKYLVAIFVGLSLLFGLQGHLMGSSDNVAHLAHLGGAVVGFVYLRGDDWIGRFVRRHRAHQRQRQKEKERKAFEEKEWFRKEVDQILDRINEVGYENITEDEKNRLKNASEYLSKE